MPSTVRLLEDYLRFTGLDRPGAGNEPVFATLYVERLALLYGQFGEALQVHPQPAGSFDQVRAAEAQVQEALCTIVAHVLGRLAQASDEEAARLGQLLEPILTQNERNGEDRRRRRRVSDVDPDSGEEQPADTATAAA